MKGDVLKIGSHEYVEVYRRPCRGKTCRTEIIMAIDTEERWHPFDIETKTSHYATCPDAQRFRDIMAAKKQREETREGHRTSTTQGQDDGPN